MSFPPVTPCAVRNHKSLTIVAEITGSPVPSVSWYVGKNPVVEQCPMYRVLVPSMAPGLPTIEKKRYQLHIKRICDDLHRKTLSVTARNEFGTDSCVVDLLTYTGNFSELFGDKVFICQ